jgi:uncharacterized protein YaaQ
MARLVIAVVHDGDANRVVNALTQAEFRVTQLRSSGGLLRARNSTLFLGVDDDRVREAIEIIERNSRERTEQVPLELLGGMDASWLPTSVTHGGATVFVVPLEEMRRV